MPLRSAIKSWFDDLLGRKEYHRYLEKETRRERVLGQILALLTFFSALAYIVWCFLNANWEHWYAFIPFVLAEIAFFFLFCLWSNLLWSRRHHSPQGVPAGGDFSVDVFIPVCHEPLEIVEQTLAAAAAIDYENKKVYLLDDGEDNRVRNLAEKYNAAYVSRPTHESRKAGNLNFALQHSTGELILILDADQVARPEIIRRIAGYFKLPHIGFVQTAQSFKLPENDPWGNSDAVFYKAMQAGKDYDNSAISCGSGVMYRRRALEDIGGFSAWNLVEDLHTSMRFHEKGWHTVYHDTSYTIGSAPVDVMSQVKQRWQWSVDSLRILFWDDPLKHKGLNWKQRLQYFHFGYHYLAFGLFLPIFFILPIWALFTHNFMLSASVWKYVVARLPYFIAQMASNKLLTEKIHSFKAFQAQAELFAANLHAIFVALTSKNRIPAYTVTSKVALSSHFVPRLIKCAPHILLIMLSMAAITYGLMTISEDFWFLAVNVFWCSWTISLLWKFIVLSLWPKLLIR